VATKQRLIEVLTTAMEKPDIANALIQRVINELNKEWVGLTDEEINDVFGDYMDSLDDGEEDDNWGYERLLEAKIKEKNT